MTSPKGNAVLVEMLGSALQRGGNALESVPGLLKRLLTEKSWREFVTQRGELVQHDRFADFVTTAPLRGIGASVELIRRIVADDIEALDLLDQALQNKPHTHLSTPDSDISTIRDPNQRGTTKDYALRKLRADAPELHAEVLAGNLSAHAAMVQAGFRPRTFTVRADSPKSVAATLRRQLDPGALAELAQLLAENA